MNHSNSPNELKTISLSADQNNPVIDLHFSWSFGNSSSSHSSFNFDNWLLGIQYSHSARSPVPQKSFTHLRCLTGCFLEFLLFFLLALIWVLEQFILNAKLTFLNWFAIDVAIMFQELTYFMNLCLMYYVHHLSLLIACLIL